MIIFVVLVILVVLVLLWVVSTYNGLVRARNKVRDQFSQIDVQLKKRSDLIPNLVETVKGYAKHEDETFEKVIKARNTYLTADSIDDKVKANNEITGAISKLFALTEAYPDLKANTNFMDLQSQLKEIEDKIGYARQFYNDSVLAYNNKVEIIPSNIIAKLFNFTKESFFQADEESRKNVKVEF